MAIHVMLLLVASRIRQDSNMEQELDEGQQLCTYHRDRQKKQQQ